WQLRYKLETHYYLWKAEEESDNVDNFRTDGTEMGNTSTQTYGTLDKDVYGCDVMAAKNPTNLLYFGNNGLGGKGGWGMGVLGWGIMWMWMFCGYDEITVYACSCYICIHITKLLLSSP